MTWPRAAAVAEVGWTAPQLKNFDDFKRRMEANYQRYEKLGINYAKSAYNVWQTVKVDSAAGKATVHLTAGSYQPGIRYTIDGSEPTSASLPYKTPFEVQLPVTIKAANFKNKKQLGETSAQSVIIN
jgi:hexosaminidase